MEGQANSRHDMWFQRDEIHFDRAATAAAGGFGAVYVGKHRRHGKVALKRLRKWGDVQKEVTIWRELNHVNVLSFLGLLPEEDFMYLVSPWVENGSLPAYLSRNPEADRIRLLRDVAEGLAYLHDKQVVHGDVKGLNVLISPNIRAMLCDFGLSKHMDLTGGETMDAVGTLPWMSPERLLGGGPGRSYKDDVYAFGITIYEALTGQRPFHRYGSFGEIVQAVCIRGERPEQIPAGPETRYSYVDIWKTASTCWAQNPDDRPSMKIVIHHRCFADFDLLLEVQRDHAVSLVRCASPEDATFRSGDPVLHDDVLQFNRDNRYLRELLKPVRSASYDADREVTIATCTPGTRTTVLETIQEWILHDNSSSVFCINGMAGLGKSTLAKTIAEWALHRGHDSDTFFLATFFFSRREGPELRNASVVLPTLAYQLARQNVVFKEQVIALLEDDPDWAASPLSLQAKKLAIAFEAFRRTNARDTAYPPLVVLDAFDECNYPGSQTLLSLLLAMAFPLPPRKPVPLKILITSRPEIQLVSIFSQYCQRREFVLHDMEKTLVQSDIRLYLEDALQKVPDVMFMRNMPRRWFETQELDALASRAGAFFIYASTSMRIIQDETVRNPKAQLKLLLDLQASRSIQYPELDHLYLGVLLQIAKCSNPKLAQQRFVQIVGPLVCLRDKLSIKGLGALIRVQPLRIFETLVPLQSLVTDRDCLKDPPDLDQLPAFYHASFYDFITSTRCVDVNLRLVPSEQDIHLAKHCLEVMILGLKQDILDLKDSTIDISELPDRFECITDSIRYAVSYWGSHLKSSGAIYPRENCQTILNLVDDFVSRCMLWWIEACSLLGLLEVAGQCVRDYLEWEGSTGTNEILLNDAQRLIMAYRSELLFNPLQLYTSILGTVPLDSGLAKTYLVKQGLTVRLGRDLQWPIHLAEWIGHEGGVNAAVSSSDGKLVVSGSEDKTVRIWEVASGTCTTTLEGQTAPVRSVALSFDGRRAVSGSEDGTIKIWDVGLEICTGTLKGHNSCVVSVSFSSDNTQVTSCSKDREIRLWDIESAMCASVREVGLFTSLAFSSDFNLSVSGSNDGRIHLWDMKTGICSGTLLGHKSLVTCSAFSPNETQIVSGSKDKTVRIWKRSEKDWVCIGLIRGHTSHISAVSFSLNGKQVISGSWDQTIRIWGADYLGKFTCKATMRGHTERINSLAFFPGGTRLISGSEDKTIRIWDTSSATSFSDMGGHTSPVNSLVFSSDGTRLVSSSKDNTIRLWELTIGTCFAVLKTGTSNVTSAEFSSDGTRVISQDDTGQVTEWDFPAPTRSLDPGLVLQPDVPNGY